MKENFKEYSSHMSPSKVEMFDQAIRQFKRMTLQMTVVNTGVNKYKKNV